MPKETICLACRQRLCCYHYKVGLTGHDLWRISRALDLSPWEFATYAEAEPDSESAFVLDASGKRYDLVLAKSTEERRYGGCVFLLKTNDGEHRCGLGELSPDQCHGFPVYFHRGLAGLINDLEGCVRHWSLTEIDIGRERTAHDGYARHADEYAALLRAWNQHVWNSQPREFGFHELCNYLENRYAERQD
jgi:Fe-S-cluster containining protein